MVSHHYALALPEQGCFHAYTDFILNNIPEEATMPLIILERQYFQKLFGWQRERRSELELAVTGRPTRSLVHITFTVTGRALVCVVGETPDGTT